jgi:hypothetical protein
VYTSQSITISTHLLCGSMWMKTFLVVAFKFFNGREWLLVPPRHTSQLKMSRCLLCSTCTQIWMRWINILHNCSLSNVHFCYFCQNQYGQEMVRRHREQIDWRKTYVDPMALYASEGEKSHRWWVDDSILILCLYNIVLYSYVIHVSGMPCSMK